MDLARQPVIIDHQFADVVDNEMHQVQQGGLQFRLILGNILCAITELLQATGEGTEFPCVMRSPHRHGNLG